MSETTPDPAANSQEATEAARAVANAFRDFRCFAGLLDIVPKAGGRIKLRLNEIQRAYCAARTRRDVVLKPRQIGFTTLEQARDVYHFLTRPGARVVATCQSITDHTPAKLLSKNYEVMFESLERIGLRLNFRTRSTTEWTLADVDASLRIVEAGASEAAAQKKGRAGTITRLHLTETAFYEYADETLNALLECVPAPEYESEIVSESTPNGAAGYFFEHYKAAEDKRSEFTAHFFPWFKQTEYRTELESGEVVEPRDDRERELVEKYGITPQQLKWFRLKGVEKGPDKRDQEYPSDPERCFLVSGRAFFDRPRVAVLMAKAVEPVKELPIRAAGAHGTFRIFAEPERGKSYVIGADTSEGTGGDNASAIIRERVTGKHTATLHGQFKPWELARALAEIGKYFLWALIAVERNNHGHACLRALDVEQKYPQQRIFHDRDEKPGWLTHEVTRTPALDAIEQAYRAGVCSTPDRLVLSEMRTFIVNARGKAEAARGANDDLVLADAICWDVLRRPEKTVVRDFSNLSVA